MKVAVLWSHLSGYLKACLNELTRMPNVSLFLSNYAASDTAPYENICSIRNEHHYEWHGMIDKFKLSDALNKFEPDVILVAGWHIPEYRSVLKRNSGSALRVMAMDNPWRGAAKQWLGVITARWYLHPLFDVAFVAGERQAQFARKMGFAEDRILKGMFSCDHAAFAAIYHARELGGTELPRAFAYIGRFSEEKGIDTLTDAYRYYRRHAEEPWPLICCGTGSLRTLLENGEGIAVKGFVQPEDLPAEVKKASCLLLPSYFEPWGVVIHEATSAGLAVICASSCGASVHLVQDGYNGYIVDTGDAISLGKAMLRYTRLADSRRREMSTGSYNLSLQLTPSRWATYFYERTQEIRQQQMV